MTINMSYKMQLIVGIVCLLIALNVNSSDASDRWPDHDISTLKLLQLVHRHGERAPVEFAPNDPFKDTKYWVEGIAELTTKGKYRMYKLGQFIRQEYGQYLGDKYSPREVYVRSSLTDRCVESTSSLLAGAYPPNQKDWQWNNGTDAQLGLVWQPFPIQTFIPHINDLVCAEGKPCAAVDREMIKIYNRPEMKQFIEKNSELYHNLSKIVGKHIRSIGAAANLYDQLKIETDHQYFWTNWTKQDELAIIAQLWDSFYTEFRYDWDSPVIRRLRGGGLVKELNKNYQKVVNKSNDKKLYVYSTHDSVVAALMNALNISNGNPPPFGATLMLELHQNPQTMDYFVRVFYQNETTINEGIPHQLNWGDCQTLTDCPFNHYLDSTQHLIYDDFDKECNEKLDDYYYYNITTLDTNDNYINLNDFYTYKTT